jgi:hypothetical protein
MNAPITHQIDIVAWNEEGLCMQTFEKEVHPVTSESIFKKIRITIMIQRYLFTNHVILRQLLEKSLSI